MKGYGTSTESDVCYFDVCCVPVVGSGAAKSTAGGVASTADEAREIKWHAIPDPGEPQSGRNYCKGSGTNLRQGNYFVGQIIPLGEGLQARAAKIPGRSRI
jgi:hypothetical protein